MTMPGAFGSGSVGPSAGGGAPTGAIMRNMAGDQTHQSADGGGFIWPNAISDPDGLVQAYGSPPANVFDSTTTVFRVSQAGVYHVTLFLTLLNNGSSGRESPPTIRLSTDGPTNGGFFIPYVDSTLGGAPGEISGTFCWEGILDPADPDYGDCIGLETALANNPFDDTLYGPCSMSIHYVRPR